MWYWGIGNVECEHESEASRRRGCLKAIRLPKRASAYFGCGKRPRAQSLGSAWSHSAAEKFEVAAWAGAQRQTQYSRAGGISGPRIEVRFSCSARRSDERR